MGGHRNLYGSNRWRRKSERFRAANPLCAYCLKRGIVKASQVADHVSPHKGDETEFYYGKLQALCKDCHDAAKKLEEHGKLAFDASGMPLSGW